MSIMVCRATGRRGGDLAEICHAILAVLYRPLETVRGFCSSPCKAGRRGSSTGSRPPRAPEVKSMSAQGLGSLKSRCRPRQRRRRLDGRTEMHMGGQMLQSACAIQAPKALQLVSGINRSRLTRFTHLGGLAHPRRCCGSYCRFSPRTA
jgi:hypothetical protein